MVNMVATHHKMVIIGVIYPAVEKYLKEYLQSLSMQSSQVFDLLLANDGVENAEECLIGYSGSYTVYNIEGSPSKIRIELIKKAIQAGYERIIFTDCDDTIANSRVEQTDKLLDHYDIVVNEFNITNEIGVIEQEKYFSNRIRGETIITQKQLLNANMMGLSNTAATDKVLTTVVKQIESREIIALDWLLWTKALLNNYKALFTATTVTNYRVYSENIAGLPQPLNRESVIHGVAIKEKHYSRLSKYGDEYRELHNIFYEVNKKIKQESWLDEYVAALQAHKIKHPMWWENIREPRFPDII